MAHNIVMETMKTLGRNINIMDKRGYILSSGDKRRIGTFHEASKKVIEIEDVVIVNNNNKRKWKGSEPGINLPIKFQNDVIGVVGITGEPEKVKEFGSSVVMMTELMIEHIYVMSQSEWKQRTQEFLLEGILSDQLNNKKIEQQCNLLEIDLTPPYSVFVFRLQQHKRPKSGFRIIYDTIEAILITNDCIYGFLDIETFVVLFTNQAQKQKVIKEKLLTHLAKYYKYIQVGMSGQNIVLNNVNNLYKVIIKIMENSDKKEIFLYYYEVERLLFKINKNERDEYKRRILNSINEVFIDTINVFFDNNLNISKTANCLYIHRNTLIYRLDRIQEETGYDPRNLNEAIILYLACKVV